MTVDSLPELVSERGDRLKTKEQSDQDKDHTTYKRASSTVDQDPYKVSGGLRSRPNVRRQPDRDEGRPRDFTEREPKP